MKDKVSRLGQNDTLGTGGLLANRFKILKTIRYIPARMILIRMAFASLILFWSSTGKAANEIILNGLYHGENLLIQNPISRGGSSYCIDGIYLNDILILRNPRISAVEIDLANFQLYEPLTIKIVHKGDCVPYLLNPSALVFKREFAYNSIRADGTSVIWIGSGEDSTGTYFLDKAIDGIWTTIAEVEAKGGFGSFQYRNGVSHDFGVNLYRLRYEAGNGAITTSNQTEFLRIPEPVTFSPKRVMSTITLSQEAFFEVFDLEMNQITKGEGTLINLAGLAPGNYILVLDGEQHQFYKQ